MHLRQITMAILVLLTFFGCGQQYKEKGSPEYIASIKHWDALRETGLKHEEGWLNLSGLYWLKEGENSFGSAENNDIVFPETAAPQMGSFVLSDSVVTLKVNDGVSVSIDGKQIKEAVLRSDQDKGTTVASYKELRFLLIVRDENRFGIRLRDLNAPLVKNFKGIDRFPINEDWKIEAQYVPLDPPKELVIPSIIGSLSKAEAHGRLDFELEGKQYSLYPIEEGSLFIIFADLTSGVETYGAGRFLSAEKPDSNNIVVLDFNKAYNPPCAFTKFATCPMPPEENKLQVRITAGEKTYGHGH